jgi:hypothetical protein
VRTSLPIQIMPKRPSRRPFLPVGMVAVAFALSAQAQGIPAAGKVVFLSGPVQLIGSDGKQRSAATGVEVQQGDQVITGRDAYVHLRMVDNGFVAVRPESRLAIELYQYDAARPEASRIKLQLATGNTRTVSGKGGEAAKQNYRFNTPMAAIGLRGTDYTVVSSEEATRVSVARGAVAVTPLGDGCAAGALGPCATTSTRELSAGVKHAYLEVSGRARAPVLVRPEQDPQGGGAQNPSGRPEEKSEGKGGDLQLADSKGAANQVAADRLTSVLTPAEPAKPAPPELLAWGRWTNYAQGGGSPAVPALLEGRSIVVGNQVFGLLRSSSSAIDLPTQGSVDFKMAGAEAFVVNGSVLSPAAVLGGNLSIDFQRRGFTTGLTVQHAEGLEQLQAQGKVSWQGLLASDKARSNMNLNGIVVGGGAEAAYLFDKSLSSGGLLGAVRWVR